MMFSSCKPFGTNCNFLNSVSSSCHEHFKSCYKYIFLNNFTFKGVSFLQIFLTMYFSQIFFLRRIWIENCALPFFVKGMILLRNRKMAPLSICLPPQKSKGQEGSHPPLDSGGAKANGFWKDRWEPGQQVCPRVPGRKLSSAPVLSDQSCVSVSHQKVTWCKVSMGKETTCGERARSGRNAALVLALLSLANHLGEAMPFLKLQCVILWVGTITLTESVMRIKCHFPGACEQLK